MSLKALQLTGTSCAQHSTGDYLSLACLTSQGHQSTGTALFCAVPALPCLLLIPQPWGRLLQLPALLQLGWDAGSAQGCSECPVAPFHPWAVLIPVATHCVQGVHGPVPQVYKCRCQKAVLKSLPFILNPIIFLLMPVTNTFPPHLFCHSHSQGSQEASRWDRWDR